MNKIEKIRMIMAAIGALLGMSGINEGGEEFFYGRLILGFILCAPMYSYMFFTCKRFLKEWEKEKKIDAELERLKNK